MSEWPISQTNAIGVSQTAPQSSALPIWFVLKSGGADSAAQRFLAIAALVAVVAVTIVDLSLT